MNIELVELGAQLISDRQYDSAKQTLLSIERDNSGVVENLIGQCEYYLENYQEALNWFKQALRHDQSQFEVYTFIGHIESYYSNYNQAIDYYQRALAYTTDDSQRKTINQQINSVQFKIDKKTLSFYSYPTEQIKLLDPKHISKIDNPSSVFIKLVEGIGEQILAIPYINAILNQYNSVIIMCASKLVPIIQRHLPDTQIISEETPLPETDARMTSYDLFTHFDNIPKSWLVPDHNVRSQIQRSFDDKPIVGVVWASPKAEIDPSKKSIPIDYLEGLRPYSNEYNFISLQYGNLETPDFITTIDHIDLYNDIESLVALTSLCSFVVGGSNSIQCIAGALGIPAYNIVHSGGGMASIWNYTDNQQSLLFPSVTVIETPNGTSDWSSCFEQVKKYL